MGGVWLVRLVRGFTGDFYGFANGFMTSLILLPIDF
jgi:cobalamin synthase